jgi:hypothetical protein
MSMNKYVYRHTSTCSTSWLCAVLCSFCSTVTACASIQTAVALHKRNGPCSLYVCAASSLCRRCINITYGNVPVMPLCTISNSAVHTDALTMLLCWICSITHTRVHTQTGVPDSVCGRRHLRRDTSSSTVYTRAYAERLPLLNTCYCIWFSCTWWWCLQSSTWHETRWFCKHLHFTVTCTNSRITVEDYCTTLLVQCADWVEMLLWSQLVSMA